MHAYRALITLGLALATSSALAHPGHESAGFFSGFAHPFASLDHVLAMFAVGLYAVSHAQRARGLLPAVFILAMLAGAGLGALGVAVPAVEAGIAASVLVLGLLIAFVVRLPLATAVPLVAVFALFHGHAHHAELGDGTLAAFAVGFALATALLHAAGWLIGRCLPQAPWAMHARRVAGALIAGAGMVFLGS